MAIVLTPFAVGALCTGSSWTVDDEGLLADRIAAVAVGQSRHIQRVLAGAQLGPPSTLASAAAAAITMLTVPGDDPSHRDGWMFQVMSWLAAVTATPTGLIRSPHMLLAHKGFDGLQLALSDDGRQVIAAVIFEDKATVNSRDTIRDEVWPEFGDLEKGSRDNVLTAEAVALLQTRPAIDADRALQSVVWNSARRYRISITVGQTHADDAGRLRLFQGYDAVAVGTLERRRGETFQVQNLRDWMSQLATRTIESVRNMVAVDV